jgi:hypothetical protein
MESKVKLDKLNYRKYNFEKLSGQVHGPTLKFSIAPCSIHIISDKNTKDNL